MDSETHRKRPPGVLSAGSSRAFQSLCGIDLERSEKNAAEEYRRVLKEHQDPRIDENPLRVEEKQEVERAVSEWMSVYTRTHFPCSTSHKKPFSVWKALKDAEELIRSKLTDHKLSEVRRAEDEWRTEEARERAKSHQAFRKWRLRKEREQLRKRREEKEQKRKQNDEILRRRVRSSEEFSAWLQRKASKSRELAILHSKKQSLHAQFRVVEQRKAAERAQLSYRHWMSRKRCEELRRQQRDSELRTESYREESRPVLLAYSANKRRERGEKSQSSYRKEGPPTVCEYSSSEDVQSWSGSEYFDD